MDKINKFFIFILGILGIFFLPIILLFYGSRDWIQSKHIENMHGGWGATINVSPHQEIGQSFTLLSENVSKIEILLPRAEETGSGYFFITNTKNQILRQGDFKIQKGDLKLILIFEPIEEIMGETYILYLNQNEGEIKNFYFYKAQKDILEGELYINRKISSGGDLFFQFYEKKTVYFLDFFGILTERISQYKPSWIKGLGVIGITSGFLVGEIALIGILIALFLKTDEENHRPKQV